MKLLVINGPNINMVGIREPGIYGSESYQALLDLCQKTCDEHQVLVEFYQSNHEGALVDRIQEAYGKIDGIVINPAAYTHTSIAILDALKVHISKVESREAFRQISYPGLACFKTITGEGIQGYKHAIEILIEKLKEKES